MGDLDLDAVVGRLAAARVAQQAVINLPNAPNATRFDACVREVFADVPALIAEVGRLRADVKQWHATYGESALREATAVIEERDRLRLVVANREAAPAGPVRLGCPAHGIHPHDGMRCLDCPRCMGVSDGG